MEVVLFDAAKNTLLKFKHTYFWHCSHLVHGVLIPIWPIQFTDQLWDLMKY